MFVLSYRSYYNKLIRFAGSEKSEQIFGAEQAKHMVSQAQAAKENGTKYCICPACTAGGAILH